MQDKSEDKVRLQQILDSKLVWEIIKNDLPDFKEKIKEILSSLQV